MTKSNRSERPSGMRKTLFKHSLSEARDCFIEWHADFGKMEILLYASFISPALLLDCLLHITRSDERFQLAGITGPLNMSKRFNIQLCVANGGSEVWYKLKVYELHRGSAESDHLEIELTGIPY